MSELGHREVAAQKQLIVTKQSIVRGSSCALRKRWLSATSCTVPGAICVCESAPLGCALCCLTQDRMASDSPSAPATASWAAGRWCCRSPDLAHLPRTSRSLAPLTATQGCPEHRTARASACRCNASILPRAHHPIVSACLMSDVAQQSMYAQRVRNKTLNQ